MRMGRGRGNTEMLKYFSGISIRVGSRSFAVENAPSLRTGTVASAPGHFADDLHLACPVAHELHTQP